MPHHGSIDSSNRNPLSPNLNPKGNCTKKFKQCVTSQSHFPRRVSTTQCKLDGELATMMFRINLNTSKFVEVATNILIVQTANIAMAMGAMAMEFQLSNQHL